MGAQSGLVGQELQDAQMRPRTTKGRSEVSTCTADSAKLEEGASRSREDPRFVGEEWVTRRPGTGSVIKFRVCVRASLRLMVERGARETANGANRRNNVSRCENVRWEMRGNRHKT